MTNSCKLFDGISPGKLSYLLSALNVVERTYTKGQIILAQGEKTRSLGVIKSGSVDAVHYSDAGNESLIAHLTVGQIFADFIAVSKTQESPVTLVANTDCEVVFIPMGGFFGELKGFENEIHLLMTNLAGIYAEQYFELKERIFCITAPTLREKIIRFLSIQKKKAKTEIFEVPFNRERMAIYLNAERSALSRELMRMKNDGVIDCRGKKFILKIYRE